MLVTKKKYTALAEKHKIALKEFGNILYELDTLYGGSNYLADKYRDKLQKQGIEVDRKKLSIGDKLFTIIFIFFILNISW